MAFLSLKDIAVAYHQKNYILQGLNLDIEKGELCGHVGPSGS